MSVHRRKEGRKREERERERETLEGRVWRERERLKDFSRRI